MALVWKTNSLFDYWRPVFNQFSKNISNGNYFRFFQKKKKKLDNRGQDILRQNRAEICLDFSSQCCKEKKIGLGCQKVPISQSRGMEGGSKFGICLKIYDRDCKFFKLNKKKRENVKTDDEKCMFSSNYKLRNMLMQQEV